MKLSVKELETELKNIFTSSELDCTFHPAHEWHYEIRIKKDYLLSDQIDSINELSKKQDLDIMILTTGHIFKRITLWISKNK